MNETYIQAMVILLVGGIASLILNGKLRWVCFAMVCLTYLFLMIVGTIQFGRRREDWVDKIEREFSRSQRKSFIKP
jgi:hypothetical protein